MNTNIISHSSPYILVFGNEKGGTGKSTLAMHIIISLLYQNHSVTTIDLDGRQGTLSRYLENRQNFKKSLLSPQHFRLYPNAEKEKIEKELDKILSTCKSEWIVIDCPGNDTAISRYAHSKTDLLVTPINDSFIDLDLLVHLEKNKPEASLRPSIYAEMVWEQRLRKASFEKKTLSWLVVRNRQGVSSKNSTHIEKILSLLAKRIGFQAAIGFRERTIFKELFVEGLTLLDKKEKELTTISHISARQELKALMSTIMSIKNANTPIAA